MSFAPLRLWITIGIVLLHSLSLLAQRNENRTLAIDSCRAAFESNHEDALSICRWCLNEYSEKQDTMNIAKSYRFIGEIFLLHGISDSSLPYLERSKLHFEGLEDDWHVSLVAASIGGAYALSGRYMEAEREMLEAINRIHQNEALGDSVHPYFMYIGELLSTINEVESAIMYYENGLRMYKGRSPVYYLITEYLIGQVYLEAGELEKAELEIRKGDSTLVPMSHLDLKEIFSTQSHAKLEAAKGNYSKAIELFIRLEKLSPAFRRTQHPETALDIGRCLAALGQTDSAIHQFELALASPQAEYNLYLQDKILRSMGDTYYAYGDYVKASEIRAQSIALNDRILLSERKGDARLLHLNQLQIDNFKLIESQRENNKKVELLEVQENYLQTVVIGSTVFILVMIGLLIRLWIVTKDLRENRRRVNRQYELLVETDRRRIELVSIIGHDLRAPIWAVRNFIELMGMSEFKGSDLNQMKEQSLESMQQIQDILESLTSWASSNDKIQNLHLEDINMYQFVESTLSTVRLHARSKGVVLINKIKPTVVIKTDKRYLSIIFRNLIVNAVKFTADGTVTLSSELIDGNHQFIIEDTGIGMATEKIEELYQSHHIASQTGSAGERGIGLGIRTVFEMCKRMNANIEIESDLGLGSKFILRNLDKSDDIYKTDSLH